MKTLTKHDLKMLYDIDEYLWLEETINLHNYLSNELAIVYQDALDYVQEKTGFLVDFPQDCPYTLEQLLDKKWFPNA